MKTIFFINTPLVSPERAASSDIIELVLDEPEETFFTAAILPRDSRVNN